MLAVVIGGDDALNITLVVVIVGALSAWMKMRQADKTAARDANDLQDKAITALRHDVNLRLDRLERPAARASESGIQEVP